MYISLNEERIILNFNPFPVVKISGPDPHYHVEVKEYKKNDDMPLHLESYKISMAPDSYRTHFELPIEFYGDFEVQIFKFVDGFGLQKILIHRFCDFSKLVRFNLVTENYDECLLWADRVRYYSKTHGCIPLVNSKFDDINKSFQSYYNITGIDVYKTYNIGRFPKTSTDFKTLDHRKEGLIWFGNWKTFWSYQHPRNWVNLTSREIVDDILGLS